MKERNREGGRELESEREVHEVEGRLHRVEKEIHREEVK